MSSPVDFLGPQQWEQLLDFLVSTTLKSRPGRTGAVCLLDGPSGSGKSTLAGALLEALPRARASRWAGLQLVQMDDFYPGWEGLAAGQRILTESVLGGYDSATTEGTATGYGYPRWDWQSEQTGSWQTISSDAPLLVEGCGALTPQTIQLADFGIWIEVDEASRKARALARDGEMFAPHWERWRAQEQRHWRENHPRQLADLSFRTVLD